MFSDTPKSPPDSVETAPVAGLEQTRIMPDAIIMSAFFAKFANVKSPEKLIRLLWNQDTAENEAITQEVLKNPEIHTLIEGKILARKNQGKTCVFTFDDLVYCAPTDAELHAFGWQESRDLPKRALELEAGLIAKQKALPASSEAPVSPPAPAPEIASPAATEPIATPEPILPAAEPEPAAPIAPPPRQHSPKRTFLKGHIAETFANSTAYQKERISRIAANHDNLEKARAEKLAQEQQEAAEKTRPVTPPTINQKIAAAVDFSFSAKDPNAGYTGPTLRKKPPQILSPEEVTRQSVIEQDHSEETKRLWAEKVAAMEKPTSTIYPFPPRHIYPKAELDNLSLWATPERGAAILMGKKNIETSATDPRLAQAQDDWADLQSAISRLAGKKNFLSAFRDRLEQLNETVRALPEHLADFEDQLTELQNDLGGAEQFDRVLDAFLKNRDELKKFLWHQKWHFTKEMLDNLKKGNIEHSSPVWNYIKKTLVDNDTSPSVFARYLPTEKEWAAAEQGIGFKEKTEKIKRPRQYAPRSEEFDELGAPEEKAEEQPKLHWEPSISDTLTSDQKLDLQNVVDAARIRKLKFDLGPVLLPKLNNLVALYRQYQNNPEQFRAAVILAAQSKPPRVVALNSELANSGRVAMPDLGVKKGHLAFRYLETILGDSFPDFVKKLPAWKEYGRT